MTALVRLAAVTIDCRDPERVAAFWSALFDVPLQPPPLPGWQRLGPLSEGGPVLTFQPVPEPKAAKARLHLDLLTQDLEQAVATVERLGGRSTGERHEYDEGVVLVMAAPEGHEFCLVQYAVQP